MLWKCCTQYASKFGKLSSGHRTGKVSFHSNPKESQAKECSNYHTIAHISHASKVMFKILQVRLQQYMNHVLQPGFRKCSQYLLDHWKSKRVPKNIYFSLLTMSKPLTVQITTNCGKFWKRWEYQTTWPASWEIYMQARKQQIELDMEQQTARVQPCWIQGNLKWGRSQWLI